MLFIMIVAGALLSAVAMLSGCAEAPAIARADLASAQAAAFRNAGNASEGVSLDAEWWTAFREPELDGLVARALASSLDVRLATTRVREAQAATEAASSRLLPTLTATGSASRQATGLPEPVKQGLPDVRAYRAAIDAEWEVDVSGAARSSARAADRDAAAATAGVASARLSVSAEITRQYALWQGARERLLHLETLLQTQRDTERLTRSREAQGQASRFDVARATGEASALAAQLPPLRAFVAVTEQQIAVLSGQSPSLALHGLAVDRAPVLLPAPDLAPGLPSDLLRNRPDVQAAEQRLAAEGERSQASRADLWPKFFLSAVLGREDLRLNLLDLSPVRYSNVALAFAMPLFNAGRLRAAVAAQSAREQRAALQYEQAVLEAVKDVEISLVTLSRERERNALLVAATAQRRVALRQAQSLYREGQIDLLQLLDVQRSLISAELIDIESRTQLSLDVIQLAKALGGGWRTPSASTNAIDQLASHP